VITCLSDLLLNDVLYKRDDKNIYILVKNEFVLNDINKIFDRIYNVVTNSWRGIANRKPFLKECKMYIDYLALKQVLIKYTRDVFGQKRLLSILKKVPKYEASLDSMEIYGIKINSFNPYIHRRAGCFMYWCCVLKPFHIFTKKDSITVPEEDQYIMDYFNEVTAYNLIRIMLSSCAIQKHCNFNECEHKKKKLSDNDCFLEITINNDLGFFKDFLYDAHIRSISRSSFELFMSRFCIVPHCRKGVCPLINSSLQGKNLRFIDEFIETPKK
jgi:hypothetical protein